VNIERFDVNIEFGQRAPVAPDPVPASSADPRDRVARLLAPLGWSVGEWHYWGTEGDCWAAPVTAHVPVPRGARLDVWVDRATCEWHLQLGAREGGFYIPGGRA
jgi:hypothetical protein